MSLTHKWTVDARDETAATLTDGVGSIALSYSNVDIVSDVLDGDAALVKAANGWINFSEEVSFTSMTFRFKLTDYTKDAYFNWSYGDGGGLFFNGTYGDAGDNQIWMSSATNSTIIGQQTLKDTRDHFLSLVLEASGYVSLYLDGTFIGLSGQTFTALSFKEFNGDSDSSEWAADYYLDDLCLYDHALTTEEVQALALEAGFIGFGKIKPSHEWIVANRDESTKTIPDTYGNAIIAYNDNITIESGVLSGDDALHVSPSGGYATLASAVSFKTLAVKLKMESTDANASIIRGAFTLGVTTMCNKYGLQVSQNYNYCVSRYLLQDIDEHFFVFTYENQNVSLFVDGQFWYTILTELDPMSFSSIGHSSNLTDYQGFYITGLRTYDRVLSDEEIVSLFDGEITEREHQKPTHKWNASSLSSDTTSLVDLIGDDSFVCTDVSLAADAMSSGDAILLSADTGQMKIADEVDFKAIFFKFKLVDLTKHAYFVFSDDSYFTLYYCSSEDDIESRRSCICYERSGGTYYTDVQILDTAEHVLGFVYYAAGDLIDVYLDGDYLASFRYSISIAPQLSSFGYDASNRMELSAAGSYYVNDILIYDAEFNAREVASIMAGTYDAGLNSITNKWNVDTRADDDSTLTDNIGDVPLTCKDITYPMDMMVWSGNSAYLAAGGGGLTTPSELEYKSVAFRFRLTDLAKDTVFSWSDTNAYGIQYKSSENTNMPNRLVLRAGASTYTGSAGKITDTDPHSLVMTCDDSGIHRVYLDGTFAYSSTIADTPIKMLSRFGYSTDESEDCAGFYLDDIRLYADVLSADDIIALTNETPPADEFDPRVVLNFDALLGMSGIAMDWSALSAMNSELYIDFQALSASVDGIFATWNALSDLLENNKVYADFSASSGMFDSDILILPVVSVTVNGSAVEFTNIELSAEEGSYCMGLDLTVADLSFWLSVEGKDNVVVIIGELAYHFIVLSKKRSLKFNTQQYIIECQSKTALMASPYAALQSTTWDNKTAKQIATEICNAAGITLHWNVLDWVIPSFSVSSQDPIQILTTLITGACTLETNRLGELCVRYLYPISPKDYAGSIPALTLSDYNDLLSIEDDYDNQAGYDAVTITADDSETTSSLTVSIVEWNGPDSEADYFNLESDQKMIGVFSTPFVAVDLKTNCPAQLEYHGVKSFEFSEQVAVVSGTATLSYRPERITGYTYLCSNLGGLSFTGTTLKSSVKGHGLVLVNYVASYQEYLLTSPDQASCLLYCEVDAEAIELSSSAGQTTVVRGSGANPDPTVIVDAFCTSHGIIIQRGRNHLDTVQYNKINHKVSVASDQFVMPGQMVEVQDTELNTSFRGKVTSSTLTMGISDAVVDMEIAYSIEESEV